MENYLSTITNYLLTQSWQIAILVIVIVAVNLALKNKSAHIRYLLWLIVLAKCLVPPLVTIPLAILPQDKMPEPTLISSGEMPAVNVEMKDTVTSEPLTLPSLPVTSPTIMERLARVTARQWLGFGWTLGVAAFLLFALVKALRTNFWLWRQRRLLPAELQTWIENLFSGLDLKTFPKVWLVKGIGQPFVWGLLRGSIYLPADFVKVNSAEHRRGVLGHELGHILRFDAAVNILQVIGQAIFWFHPFVWWANKKIRAEREKCCDEMAIARLGAKAKDYSSAIVNILISEHESTRPVPSLAVAGPVKNIEERIKTMLRPGKKFYKRPSLIAATAILLAGLLTVPTSLVLTARAETTAKSEEKATKSLHEAAADGDIEQVKSLISKGADVNSQDNRGASALELAAKKGHRDVVEILINKGADINAKSNGGWTPLLMAVAGGHKEVVKLLVAKGADVNIENNWGWTPLHTAASGGHKEVAKILIDEGANVNAKRAAGWTALHQAAAGGHKDLAESLIDSGADVNAKKDDGGTPAAVAMVRAPRHTALVELMIAKGAKVSDFHLAAYMGDIEKLKNYIQDGTDINLQDECGSTALHAAANSGKKEIAEFLISKGAHVDAKNKLNMTPLFYAATHNHQDMANLLLAKGADINAKDDYGYTLLYYAIWDIDKDAVSLLINKGANVNVQADDGDTPLNNAIWMRNKEIVELLINKGADVNAEDKDGYTPMYWAAMQDSKDLVELLSAKGATAVSTIHLSAAAGDLDKVKEFIEEGTHIDAKDKAGLTALQWAISRDHKDVAAFLIDKGADINVRGKRGQTPLHQACLRGNKDMAEFLIAKGANVNVKDDTWYTTPLIAAIRNGHEDIAKLLIAEGADVNARGRGDYTALHWTAMNRARMPGSTDIMKLLLAKGADIEARQEHGATPLACAAFDGNAESTKFLIEHGADIEAKLDDGETTPLFRAVRQQYVETAKLLLAKGADIHVRWRRLTPLHVAMMGNQLSNRKSDKEMVKLLIEKGLEAPPIHLTAFFGDLQKVKKCVADGTKIDKKDAGGYTPLHCAVCGDHMDIARFLLSKGADVNAKTTNGRTALRFTWTVDMAGLLIVNGANVNIQDEWGATVLHGAVNRNNHQGEKPLVELLLKNGADVNVKRTDGQTPFHVACRNGNKGMVELLIANGANVNAKTDKGETPMSVAKNNERRQVVELLRKHGARE